MAKILLNFSLLTPFPGFKYCLPQNKRLQEYNYTLMTNNLTCTKKKFDKTYILTVIIYLIILL